MRNIKYATQIKQPNTNEKGVRCDGIDRRGLYAVRRTPVYEKKQHYNFITNQSVKYEK
jgi:hypothetical protein